jgi:hypothetical protein
MIIMLVCKVAIGSWLMVGRRLHCTVTSLMAACIMDLVAGTDGPHTLGSSAFGSVRYGSGRGIQGITLEGDMAICPVWMNFRKMSTPRNLCVMVLVTDSVKMVNKEGDNDIAGSPIPMHCYASC